MGEGACIEGIRLGQRPGGFGEGPGLAGIDHHREARRRQGRHHSSLVASCGLADHPGGLQSLESLHQGGNPGVIVTHDPAFARGPQGDIALGFGDLDANTTLWGRQHHSSLAQPCQIRAAWLRATVRALEGVDVTTLAPRRSQWTTAESVYHVRVTGILSHLLVKIYGCRASAPVRG